METELFLVGTLPQGAVFSDLLHETSNPHTHAAVGDGHVLVGACPTGGLVAFVSPSYQAQFIVGQSDSRNETETVPSFSYTNAFQGILDIDREPMSSKPRPQATSVLVVPIAFQTRQGSLQKSSVVLVGFSDGYVRGYSKSGQRVLAQSMHTEAVNKLTCMAPSGSQLTSNSNQSNVIVLYPGAVCVVDGRSLVNTIKTYVQSKTSVDDEDREMVFLSYKKWKLMDQTSTIDVALLGHSTPSAFDHLCEASSVAGFDATVRSAPTPEARLIAIGETPMIALYKITKDAGQLNMSEVVHAVASKMTSAVLGKISQASGWLRWGKGDSSSPKPKPSAKEKIQLSSNLPMSTNIPDSRRTMVSITVSPKGNLAAIVDSFGRILLLECESLVIRRIWKGYRDAQCGWLLVHDSPPPKKAERGKRRRPKPAPHSLSSESDVKKAQCLCIYAPRRGVVELWPVQEGSRVAVFQVGKGCRLLYSPHGLFTFDPNEDEGRIQQDVGVVKGIRETVLLLCPDGQLVTFSVPFPVLTRLGDPTSFDAHLMKKLPQALQSGDMDLLIQIFSGLKSSQSMKQAVDILIGAHSAQNISYDVIIKLLNIALERIDGIDPAMYPLYRYVGGVKQGAELLQGIEELVPSQATPTINSDKLEKHLQDLCGLPAERAATISTCLKNYFSSASQRKTVVKKMDFKAFMRCFDLSSKVGNVLLSSSRPVDSLTSRASGTDDSLKVTRSFSRSFSTHPVRLTLKETVSASTLLDVGSTLFLSLLTKDVAEYSISSLFQSCGITVTTLLSLLCRVILSALSTERNPSILLHRLNRLLTVITASQPHVGAKPSSSLTEEAVSSKIDEASGCGLWTDVCLQCAQSYNVGHALLIILLGQKFASATVDADSIDTMEQDWESWEPVTSEKEEWISLMHHLEVLTLVSNVIGRDSLATLPPAPYAVCDEEGSGVGGEKEIDVRNLLPLNESHKEGLCASTLENHGPGLIAHCLCRWLIQSHVPAEFVARIPSDPHDNVDPSHSRLVFQLSPILKLLPHTLSHEALLTHCAWQAACDGSKDPNVALEFVSHVHNIKLIPGIAGVLWHCVYENTVVKVIEALKRGSLPDDRSSGVLSVSRNLFSWLYRLTFQTDELNQETTADCKDLLSISNPPGKISLMGLVSRFPQLNPTVVRTYFELLLFTEVSSKHITSTAVTVAAFFPTWLRGALKKGAFKTAWQEQVPVQLQQKRTKYLCETVGVYLAGKGPPKLAPTLACVALQELPLSVTSSAQPFSLEIADFKEFIFLLVDLWGLDGDIVRKQWACAFFAAGLADQGKEAFLGIKDKSRVSQDLVSFSGALTDHLLHRIENKTQRLALMAQVSPSLIEWLRNQNKSPLLHGCLKLDPNWVTVSQLLSLIQPYVSGKTAIASIMTALSKLVQNSAIVTGNNS